MLKYHEEQKIQLLQRLREKLNTELPAFLKEYFRGIDSSTEVRTRYSYAVDLHTFFLFLKRKNSTLTNIELTDIPFSILESIQPEDIDEYMEYLSFYTINEKEYHNGATSKARQLCALSNMFKFFIQRKKLKNNPVDAVARPSIHEHNIVALEPWEMESLISEIESGKGLSKRELIFHAKIKYRDIAIVTLFLLTGIRVSELVGLDLDDIKLSSENMSIRVIRKGGNEDLVYISEEVKKALTDYLENERSSLLPYPNDDEPALFLSLQGKRMSVRSIQDRLKQYIDRSESIHKRITPHKLRSTYGTNLYNKTGDIYLVADVLGHKDITTTRNHYAKQDITRKQAAASIVSIHEK